MPTPWWSASTQGRFGARLPRYCAASRGRNLDRGLDLIILFLIRHRLGWLGAGQGLVLSLVFVKIGGL